MKHITPAEVLTTAVRKKRLSAPMLTGCVRASETLGLALLALALRLADGDGAWRPNGADLLIFSTLALATAAVLKSTGGYTLEALRATLAPLLRAGLIWCGAVLAFMAVDVLLGLEQQFSREFLARWLVSGAIFLAVERLAIGFWVRRLTRRGRLDRNAVIVGGGAMAEKLLEALAPNGSTGSLTDVRILGLFDDRADARSPDMVAGYPRLGTVDDLLLYARHVQVDQVIFALPGNAEGRILAMLRKLWVLPVDIRLAANANLLRFRPRAYTFIGAVPAFDLLNKPLDDSALLAKAIFDRVVGALLLIAIAPLMALIALGVRLTSPGPALFRQERHGFNNERIVVYKFRSLYHDQCDPFARKLVTRDDPRVTPLGRFLRRSSLDELPQLINVAIKGDLSLVGPRPHATKAKIADHSYDEAVDGYCARHRVKPGVTGWAQVNGWRGEIDTVEKIQRRVECDLAYIDNWSMLLDVCILALTPFALLLGDNAY